LQDGIGTWLYYSTKYEVIQTSKYATWKRDLTTLGQDFRTMEAPEDSAKKPISRHWRPVDPRSGEILARIPHVRRLGPYVENREQ
jgi:hypothetical protein